MVPITMHKYKLYVNSLLIQNTRRQVFKLEKTYVDIIVGIKKIPRILLQELIHYLHVCADGNKGIFATYKHFHVTNTYV